MISLVAFSAAVEVVGHEIVGYSHTVRVRVLERQSRSHEAPVGA